MKKYLIFGFTYYSYYADINDILFGSKDTLEEAVKFVEEHFDSDDGADIYDIRDKDTWVSYEELVKEFRNS